MIEEEMYGEKALGDRGGGGMQPVQDEGPQVIVPNAPYSALQGHNGFYTFKEPTPEPFFRIRNAKSGQIKVGQFPVAPAVPKTAPVPAPVPAPPADVCQTEFSEALEGGCSSPMSPTTFENLNISIRDNEFAGHPVVAERLVVFDRYLHGHVVPGTENSVNMLLDDLKDLSLGTHGVLADTKTCQTNDGRYEENEHFIVNRKLGQGMSGTVDLCTDSASRDVFVRKTLPDRTHLSRREVDVLKGLKHRNIAQFKGFILREGKPEIYLEYGGLALNKLISDPVRYKELVTDRNVVRLIIQGLEALHFLDLRGILHLDVKPENVCVTENLELKLTDFGSCKAPQDPLQFQGWTPEYMSPEACTMYLLHLKNASISNTLTGKTDVYAFGATIATMRYRVNPLTAYFLQNKSQEQYMKEERIKIILQLHQNPGFMSALAQQIPTLTASEKLLLAKLLAGDCSERCNAKEALLFVQEVMLSQFGPEIRPARLLAPSAGVCEEVEPEQPPCPAPCQPIEEEEEVLEEDMEIDMRACKKRSPIQTATQESTSADAMSRVAGQTGQCLVFEDAQTNQLTNAVTSDQTFFFSAKMFETSKGSSTAPTKMAPAINFGVTVYNVVPPAGNAPPAFRRPSMSGKGISMSGKGAMARKSAPPQQSLGKTILRRHLTQRQKSHPYRSDGKFAGTTELPDFDELM